MRLPISSTIRELSKIIHINFYAANSAANYINDNPAFFEDNVQSLFFLFCFAQAVTFFNVTLDRPMECGTPIGSTKPFCYRNTLHSNIHKQSLLTKPWTIWSHDHDQRPGTPKCINPPSPQTSLATITSRIISLYGFFHHACFDTHLLIILLCWIFHPLYITELALWEIFRTQSTTSILQLNMLSLIGAGWITGSTSHLSTTWNVVRLVRWEIHI